MFPPDIYSDFNPFPHGPLLIYIQNLTLSLMSPHIYLEFNPFPDVPPLIYIHIFRI